jgi:CheY-like chemotaxis protein
VEARALSRETSVVTLTLPVVRPVTVLLVDDNPDTRRLFRRYLSGANYRAIEAGDGRHALELARQARPGAIVLDVMLPSQDGWEILQALRNDLTTEHIPVVVCSVLHQEELAEALGATAYLAKPVSRDALLAALRRALSRPARSPAPLGRAG